MDGTGRGGTHRQIESNSPKPQFINDLRKDHNKKA